MDRTKILIYSIPGIFFLIILGWFSYNYHSSKQPIEVENTNLGLDVDTKYTYEDMIKSNEKKGDQGNQYQYKNIPTNIDYSNQTKTKSTSEENRYAEEKKQIQNVMYHIQRQKEITTHETNAAPENTSKHSTLKTRLTSYHQDVTEYEPQEQNTQKTQKLPNRGKLFFDSSDEVTSANTSNEIVLPAVIHGEQSIKDGSSVKIRTIQDYTIDGVLVPKNTFLFGQVHIGENRINIHIGGFLVNRTIVSTSLTVYDQDGELGLMLIGGNGEGVTEKAIDIADGSSSNILSNVPIIGGVAQATKDILRNRQTKSKQVVLASNYKLILKKS